MVERKTPVLTKRQAAERLRVSTRTIDSWRARGVDVGAVYTPTGRVRFAEETIDKLLRTRSPQVVRAD